MSDLAYRASEQPVDSSSAGSTRRQKPAASGGLLGARAGSLPNVLFLLGIAIGGGVVAVVLFGLRASSISEGLAIGTSGLLISGASLGSGGLIGFLFSLPRASAEKAASFTGESGTQALSEMAGLPAYARNNNLVDVSDWLTKILLGVGLTQLTGIAGTLRRIGEYLAPALGGFPNSSTFAIAIIIYFAATSFFLVYLWGTLILPSLLRESDIQTLLLGAKNEGKAEREKEIEGALFQGRGMDGRRILWVDDRPESNEYERKLLTGSLSVEIENCKATDEAIDALDKSKFDLVITDMARPEGSRAGYDLLAQVKAKYPRMPVLIYSNSERQEDDAEARGRGAIGSTNSPVRLLELTTRALRGITTS